MKKLKPCPFCGKEPKYEMQVIDGWLAEEGKRVRYIVGCESCGFGMGGNDQQEVFGRWNRRMKDGNADTGCL